jgi:hypothetical protein
MASSERRSDGENWRRVRHKLPLCMPAPYPVHAAQAVDLRLERIDGRTPECPLPLDERGAVVDQRVLKGLVQQDDGAVQEAAARTGVRVRIQHDSKNTMQIRFTIGWELSTQNKVETRTAWFQVFRN